MEDRLIIKLFFERSENAITELSTKYGKLCRIISYNILGDERDAEECVNDTFLAIWNHIPPENPNPLSAYVCKIARNLSLKKYHSNTAAKRNSRYDEVLEELEECLHGNVSVEEEILAKELAERINFYLGGIKPKDRLLFTQRYWFGDSVEEIAGKFGMSANSVKVRLHRIRKRLKEYLEREGYIS